MNRLLQSAILLVVVWLTPWASATEPLYDRLTVDSETGLIFPEKCCWLELPDSEQLRSARRAETCSAMGGPVGQFMLLEGKIWLAGLYRCGGAIPLKSMFPDLPDPAMAEWLSGKFMVRVGYLCRNRAGATVYKREIGLMVQRGLVKSRDEKVNDDSSCAPRHNLSLLLPSRAWDEKAPFIG